VTQTYDQGLVIVVVGQTKVQVQVLAAWSARTPVT